MDPKYPDKSALSRRAALLAMLAGGVGLIGACSPARIAWHLYPENFDENPGRVDAILRAFVATVVPGVDPAAPNLVRAFYDDYFPLRTHRNYVAAELCRECARIGGGPAFEYASSRVRIRVIERLLARTDVSSRLFTGSVFLTQIACYAGIYDSANGCSLIDFPGYYRVRPIHETSYPDPQNYLARPITTGGNYS